MNKFRRSRLALIATAAVTLVLAGWYGWWVLAGAQLRHAIDDWSAAERGRGGSLAIGALELSGFPLSIRAEAREVAVARADGGGWRTPELVAEAPLWWPVALSLRLTGRQEIHLPDGQDVTASGGDGRVVLGGASGITAASLTLAGVAVLPAGPAFDRLTLSATLPSRVPANGSETGLGVSLEAAGYHLTAADAAGQPLGPVIQRLALAARVQGAPPALESRSLTAWSQSGGSLLIDSAQVRWGAVTVDTNGALELDRALQPAGTLNTEISGFGEAVDALVAGGWIRAKDAHTVNSVLTGLSPRAGSGGKQAIKLPVSLHDRFVHLGPFRLIPLPQLVWQGGQRMPNQTTEAPPAIRQ